MKVEIYNYTGDGYHVGISTHLACEDYQFENHTQLLSFLTKLFTPCTTSNTSPAPSPASLTNQPDTDTKM